MYQKVREEVHVTPFKSEFRGTTVTLIRLVRHQRRLLAGHAMGNALAKLLHEALAKEQKSILASEFGEDAGRPRAGNGGWCRGFGEHGCAGQERHESKVGREFMCCERPAPVSCNKACCKGDQE